MARRGARALRAVTRSVPALLAAALLATACNVDVPAERLPRFDGSVPPPNVVLVLGSGGPRGFAHVGVLKVLEEAGLRPDMVIGCSVGAMVGALYASGRSATEIERMAMDLDMRAFFLEWAVLRGRPASGAAVQRYVSEAVGEKPIEALPMAFAAAATRVSDGRLALFNRGDTGLAVRASSASPGQFEAVRVGEELYVDGDEASPVPILAARALGAKVVIAVDVSAHESTTPPGVPEEWKVKDRRRAKQVAKEAPAADLLLHPDIGYYAGHSESYRRGVIDIAERFTRERLPQIRAAFERARSQKQVARIPAGVASR